MNEMTVKSPGRTRFYWLLLLLMVLIALRYAFQINIPPLLFVAVIVFMALMGDANEVLALCICCIPLHESVDLFYALGLCMMIYVVKEFRSLRLNTAVIPVLVMLLWELLHCFRSDFSPVKYVADCLPLMLLAVVMCCRADRADYGFIVRAMSVTTAALCATLLLKLLYLTDMNIIKTFVNLQRLGSDASNVGLDNKGIVNPNTLGIICVLATTGLMQLRMIGEGTKQDVILAMFLVVFGALTASRTYLVCLVLMLMLLLFAQNGTAKEKLRYLAGLLLFIGAAILMLYVVFPDLMAYYVGRFLDTDITTGRDGLMVAYHEYIISDPKVLAFGIGLNNYAKELVTVQHVAVNVPHNGVQELIIAWGVPGVLLFVWLFAVMIGYSRADGIKQRLLNYIQLIIILVKMQAGQMLCSPYTLIALSYAYLSMTQNFTLSAEGEK